MLSAALLAARLAGAPAAAAAAPSSTDCVARLRRALSTEPVPGLEACLTPDALWQDADGVAKGREAALSRAAALRRAGGSFDGAAPVVALSGLTILPGFLTKADAMTRVFALEGAPPWRAVRVYWAERGWPGKELDARAPLATVDQLHAALRAFNERFGAGDVDGWVSTWRPDALFYSFAGPCRGEDIRYFFEHQKARYERPRMTAASERPGPTPGSFVMLQTLSGTCRANGGRFDMPMLLLLDFEQGKIRLAYEAFASNGDGCGEF